MSLLYKINNILRISKYASYVRKHYFIVFTCFWSLAAKIDDNYNLYINIKTIAYSFLYMALFIFIWFFYWRFQKNDST